MFKDSTTFVSSSFPKHAKYKLSEVDWLDEVPEHWDFIKGKWLFVHQQNKVAEGDEIITCFRNGEVTLRRNRRTAGFTNALLETGYQHVDKGDLVIHGMDAFAGAIGVSDAYGKSTPVYIVVKAAKQEVSLNFSAYLLRYYARVDFILSLASGIRQRSSDFRWSNLKELQLLTPPISEQEAIVNFLDSKTKEIEEAINLKQRTIELLEEYKHSLIQKAVTKGLDPTVPMKDSGVNWLGEVPKHWRIISLRNVLTEVSEKGFAELPLLSITRELGIIERDVDDQEGNHNFIPPDLSGYKRIKRGNFGMNKMKAWQGSYGVSDFTGIVSPAYFVYSLSNAIVPSFFHWAVRSKVYVGEMAKASDGVRIGQWDLSKHGLKEIRLAAPINELEQKAIVNFLESKTKEIEEAKSGIQVQIKHLKEYKDSLIESAVTGKIKVAEP